jgi:hypothetical protein
VRDHSLLDRTAPAARRRKPDGRPKRVTHKRHLSQSVLAVIQELTLDVIEIAGRDESLVGLQ